MSGSNVWKGGSRGRGANFERRVWKLLERSGYFVVRSAGSHGPADLVAITNGELLLIQCKIPGKLSSEAREALQEISDRVGATALLAYQEFGLGVLFQTMDGAVWELPWFTRRREPVNEMILASMARMPACSHWPDRPNKFDWEKSQVFQYIRALIPGCDRRFAQRVYDVARGRSIKAVLYDHETRLWRGNPDWGQENSIAVKEEAA